MGFCVADRPIRNNRRWHSDSSRSSDSARCEPRLLPAMAWISSTITVARAGQHRAAGGRAQQHVQRFGRGHQDVRRLLAQQVAFGLRRVAGAHGGADRHVGQAELFQLGADACQRRFQVDVDVVRQRLQRRHVDHAGGVGQHAAVRHAFAHQRVDRGEEGGQRLARAGRRGDQGVPAGADRRPRGRLRRGGRGKRAAKPGGDGRMEIVQRAGIQAHRCGPCGGQGSAHRIIYGGCRGWHHPAWPAMPCLANRRDGGDASAAAACQYPASAGAGQGPSGESVAAFMRRTLMHVTGSDAAQARLHARGIAPAGAARPGRPGRRDRQSTPPASIRRCCRRSRRPRSKWWRPSRSHDPLTYEKPLPLELLPFQERNDKYYSIGTAFAIGNNRYVTAAHVLQVGIDSLWGEPALRDASGQRVCDRQDREISRCSRISWCSRWPRRRRGRRAGR